MGNIPNKVLMGSVGSNVKEVMNKAGTIEAGLVVKIGNDDSISATTGTIIGVSLGRNLSDTARTAICRKGLKVPVKLTAAFNPTIGAQVYFVNATGLAGASDGGNTTAVNATYSTGRVGGSGQDKGISEAGTDVGVAYIDFPGGL